MEKQEYKALKEQLFSKRRNGFDRLDGAERAPMEAYCEDYKAFLDLGKTERLCAAEAVRLAEQAGYRPYRRGAQLKAGDKVYVSNRGKAVLLAHIGRESLASGAQITAAHIDSPRLDLKPNPLYEDGELAYFKTHYYGGLRKYQWVTIPLELHGVVALRDGTSVQVNIGADAGDPRLVITDLLPHLGADQNKKTLGEAIPAETLNLLLGSEPIGDAEESGRVKLAVMKLLNEKYGITEDDFTSAELEAVPAVKATDIGLDRSMIGAYGHDDRVCAYAALRALLDLDKTPAKTAVCVLADKEEIGSDGVTGMQSAAFDTFMEDLCESQGVDGHAVRRLRHVHGGPVREPGRGCAGVLREVLLPQRRRDGGLRPQLLRRVRKAQRRLSELRHRPVQVHRRPGQVRRLRRGRGDGGLYPQPL